MYSLSSHGQNTYCNAGDPRCSVHLLCARLQVCAGSRAALAWEHGLEHGVLVAVVPLGSAEA